jgi:hypothetical protein
VLFISAAEDKTLLVLLLQGVETAENNLTKIIVFLLLQGVETGL